MWFALVDEVGDDRAFLGPDGHEGVGLRELVDQVEDGLRIAADGVNVWLVEDEVQEFELAALLSLVLLVMCGLQKRSWTGHTESWERCRVCLSDMVSAVVALELRDRLKVVPSEYQEGRPRLYTSFAQAHITERAGRDDVIRTWKEFRYEPQIA